MVLPGSNPDLVGAPVVPDTGWFNQKKEIICLFYKLIVAKKKKKKKTDD